MNINSHVLEIIQGVIGKYCETQNRTFSITLINKLHCNYVCLQIPPEQMIAQCEEFLIPALASVKESFLLTLEANIQGVSFHCQIDDSEQVNTLDFHGLLATKESVSLALDISQNVDVLTDCEALLKSCLKMSANTHDRFGLNFKLFNSNFRESVQLEDLRHLSGDALTDRLNSDSLNTHIKLCTINDISELSQNHKLSKKILGWPFFDTDLITILAAFNTQTRLSVLVADDSLPSQIATKVMLEMLGCLVTCAENGASALTLAQNESFDLLLLDERMPGMFGSDVAQQLVSQNTPNNNTPKVILTGLTGDEQIAELFEKGITHYLQKPVTKAVLEKFIKPWQLAS
ncbi:MULTISPECIES: response regulator [unclassified Pseudoalteromonas]|uniref:response regulator n=1 Tax=unclassified Pseudoalteromonas TaxID=194690 RepID=UPI0018CCD773|nr:MULTISPECIES: response regulator [unclassified Pseudoalteromonas]MBH0027672.1 response regulator [Pseudoalteromonas sp. SWN29]MBH0037426.1 response regulator [Pseudoalteromonas sp. SWN166]